MITTDPVAFKIFGIPIMWYGVLITLGIVIAINLAIYQLDEERGVSKDEFFDYLLVMILVSVITTRLYYVIFYDLSYYIANPLQILNFRQGGMAIHGGIIGGLVCTYIFSKKKGISFYYLIDIITPGLALAQGIGRWGNYINQEAHGGPTDLPWGIIVDGVKVHPTFLYESILDVGIFLLLFFYIRKNKKFDGQMGALYLIIYSTGRFFIEGLRTDSLYMGSFRVAQIVSVLGILAGLLIYLKSNKTK